MVAVEALAPALSSDLESFRTLAQKLKAQNEQIVSKNKVELAGGECTPTLSPFFVAH